jgi:rare lipoprotein A
MLLILLLSLFTHDTPFETVTVSWYGQPFHGRITASGIPFNMNEFTAAHCELPLGTIVEMVNLENGITIEVWITDTGPWRYNSRGYAVYPLRSHPIRKFDLSRKAFDVLSGGNLGDGTMVIQYRVIGRNITGLRYNLGVS